MKYRIPLLLAVCTLVGVQLAKADLRDGLISYWPLDSLETDTNTFQTYTPDVTPNTNHLVDQFLMNTGDFVPGVRSNAASFDGFSKYLLKQYTAGDDNGLSVYNKRYYTIAMWVRDGKFLSGTNQLTRAVFAEANVNIANPFIRFTTDTAPSSRTNLFAAAIRDDNNTGGINWFFGNPAQSFADNGKATGTNMPFDGNWHHIAWVDENGTARLYVDGQLDPHVFKNTRVSEPPDVAAANRGLTLNTLTLGAVRQSGGSGVNS